MKTCDKEKCSGPAIYFYDGPQGKGFIQRCVTHALHFPESGVFYEIWKASRMTEKEYEVAKVMKV